MLVDRTLQYRDENHFRFHHLRLAIRELRKSKKEYEEYCKLPDAFDFDSIRNRYSEYQSRYLNAERVVRGLKNYNRGVESLDSFTDHGGINTPNYKLYLMTERQVKP